MDMQRRVVDNYCDDHELPGRLGEAIVGVAGIKVVYVAVASRGDGVGVRQRNAAFSRLSREGAFGTQDPASAIHAALAPAPGEPVVIKRRISAFAGSDLDLVLRAHDMDTLVPSGVATRGVVLATLRQAEISTSAYKSFPMAAPIRTANSTPSCCTRSSHVRQRCRPSPNGPAR